MALLNISHSLHERVSASPALFSVDFELEAPDFSCVVSVLAVADVNVGLTSSSFPN